MSEWISVYERLPGNYVCVLVKGRPFGNKGEMFSFAIRVYEEWHEPDTQFGWIEDIEDADIGFYDLEGVTHWMPLPEPPK